MFPEDSSEKYIIENNKTNNEISDNSISVNKDTGIVQNNDEKVALTDNIISDNSVSVSEDTDIVQNNDEIITSMDNIISDDSISVNEDINIVQNNNETITSTNNIISDNSVFINEDIKKVAAGENTEPRHIVISTDNPSFESGLEIKYTSLQLKNFPIRYKNFSEKMDFDEIVNIGTTSIKIGNTSIHNVTLKILVYSKFKLLEIKTREFKLALSIELNDKQTLVKKDDYFKYDIHDKVKTSRLSEVVEIFKRIFAGENITFKYNQLIGDISFENRLEVYKFTIITETINSYKFITNELELYKEKVSKNYL